MRKRVMSPDADDTPSNEHAWLDLEQLAQVEISSEEQGFPIEGALLVGAKTGWRAAQPGRQTIRLRFDQSQHLHRIRLVFVETERQRTQEFVLRWSPDSGQVYREIVRQQWNFSPPGGTREVEDYHVDLMGVMLLDMEIVPDISGGGARASLAELRLA
jgi:hypothetical protein